MIIAEIVGTLVCTQKDASLVGKKMMLVQPVNIKSLKPEGNTFVALDAVGAGSGELVMVVSGGSARMADNFSKVAVDQSIVGIVDRIEIKNSVVFETQINKLDTK